MKTQQIPELELGACDLTSILHRSRSEWLVRVEEKRLTFADCGAAASEGVVRSWGE